jgi:hypothetical protein
VLFEMQADVRMALQERGERGRQEFDNRGDVGKQPDVSARAQRVAGNLVLELRRLRQQRTGAGQQGVAGRGQRDAAGAARDQRRPQRLLHVRQTFADRRGNGMRAFRGARDAPGIGDGNEQLEVAQIEFQGQNSFRAAALRAAA